MGDEVSSSTFACAQMLNLCLFTSKQMNALTSKNATLTDLSENHKKSSLQDHYEGKILTTHLP